MHTTWHREAWGTPETAAGREDILGSTAPPKWRVLSSCPKLNYTTQASPSQKTWNHTQLMLPREAALGGTQNRAGDLLWVRTLHRTSRNRPAGTGHTSPSFTACYVLAGTGHTSPSFTACYVSAGTGHTSPSFTACYVSAGRIEQWYIGTGTECFAGARIHQFKGQEGSGGKRKSASQLVVS